MKKLIILSLFLASCSNDDAQPATPQNCDCDLVKEATTFNIVGTPSNPSVVYHTVYITINQCTGVQKTKTYDTTNPNECPAVGQCR